MPDRLVNLSLSALALAIIAGPVFGDEILRDPTRPYVASKSRVVAAPRFAVNAIIVSAERRVAIVNGRRVAVGDSVAGARVIVIEKDHLFLEKDGKRIRATLNDGASRQ